MDMCVCTGALLLMTSALSPSFPPSLSLSLSLRVCFASIREMDADAGACMCNKYFRSTDMTQDTLFLVRQTDRWSARPSISNDQWTNERGQKKVFTLPDYVRRRTWSTDRYLFWPLTISVVFHWTRDFRSGIEHRLMYNRRSCVVRFPRWFRPGRFYCLWECWPNSCCSSGVRSIHWNKRIAHCQRLPRDSVESIDENRETKARSRDMWVTNVWSGEGRWGRDASVEIRCQSLEERFVWERDDSSSDSLPTTWSFLVASVQENLEERMREKEKRQVRSQFRLKRLSSILEERRSTYTRRCRWSSGCSCH